MATNDRTHEKTVDFIRRYWSDDETTAKHERLSQAFVAAINDGFWQPGARLPAEADLVRATPCSLGTVQKALRTLSDADVIERRRGSGTIVADHDRPLNEPWHMRFHDPNDPARALLPVFARVLDRDTVAHRGPWSAPLQQEKRRVVRLRRSMSIDGRFDVFNAFYARPDRFPALLDAPIAALNAVNLKKFLALNHHLMVHSVRQDMTFGVVNDAVAQTVGWQKGAPCSLLTAVGYDPTGAAVYYQEYYIPENALSLALGTMTRP